MTAIAYSRQSLVHQITADFTTEYGTRFQICASTESSLVHFGTMSGPESSWLYGKFFYADRWRENNGWPSAWTEPMFRRMVEDFMEEGKS